MKIMTSAPVRVFNKRSKGDRIVRTVSQACDVDLAEIHCGCHSNIKGALGNVISTIGHSNSKRTLRQRRQEADGCDHTNYQWEKVDRLMLP